MNGQGRGQTLRAGRESDRNATSRLDGVADRSPAWADASGSHVVSTSDTRRALRAAVPSPAGAGESDLLRAAFRRAAAGVSVITAASEDGRPVGFTATSVASVATDPPVVSFNIGARSSSWPVLEVAEYVAVHTLGEGQEELAARFARSGADRFAPPTRWRRGFAGVPVLESVPAWLLCRVIARVPAADHRVVLAEVVGGDACGPGRPLVYHNQRFNVLRD